MAFPIAGKLHRVYTALRELGLRQLGWYAIYQLGLRSGHYRRVTPPPPVDLPGGLRFIPPLQLPERSVLRSAIHEQTLDSYLKAAAEILSGQVRLFAGPPCLLGLCPPPPLDHWTAYEGQAQLLPPAGPSLSASLLAESHIDSMAGSFVSQDQAPVPVDIKLTWEPARFGWALTLAQAYQVDGDERYAQAFWEYTSAFLDANPPYLGPNWLSAQEAALRLIAISYALGVFTSSPHLTAQRGQRLAQAIADHARRIPSTLPYARAQNNNHLLSEAAGLFTAGAVLPDHPAAPGWRDLGWRTYNEGLQSQIALDGSYSQHSANYHRLMLQLSLWMDALRRACGLEWPALSASRLAAATRWLDALLDPASGRVPNLGPNDGSLLFPALPGEFDDYRPTVQAASRAFLSRALLGDGRWDELSLWFGLVANLTASAAASPMAAINPMAVTGGDPGASDLGPSLIPPATQEVLAVPLVLRQPDGLSWVYLRAAHFTGRPGHADQLHLDLWWRGLNLALDPGAYLYNASPPWDNALRHTIVHNTVAVEGGDQMLSAGRFLYLERAQAVVLQAIPYRLAAEHDGYRRLGLVHRRVVECQGTGWQVVDQLLPISSRPPSDGPLSIILNWNLPDYPWQADLLPDGRARLLVDTPYGPVTLLLSAELQGLPSPAPASARLQIVRAGELIFGAGPTDPTWGWTSPTYSVKEPALSLHWSATARPPIQLVTEWILPTHPPSIPSGPFLTDQRSDEKGMNACCGQLPSPEIGGEVGGEGWR